MGVVGGSLCDGNMWGESGRVGCIWSRVWGPSERVWGLGGLDRCGCLGGEWARESVGGEV